MSAFNLKLQFASPLPRVHDALPSCAQAPASASCPASGTETSAPRRRLHRQPRSKASSSSSLRNSQETLPAFTMESMRAQQKRQKSRQNKVKCWFPKVTGCNESQSKERKPVHFPVLLQHQIKETHPVKLTAHQQILLEWLKISTQWSNKVCVPTMQTTVFTLLMGVYRREEANVICSASSDNSERQQCCQTCPGPDFTHIRSSDLGPRLTLKWNQRFPELCSNHSSQTSCDAWLFVQANIQS